MPSVARSMILGMERSFLGLFVKTYLLDFIELLFFYDCKVKIEKRRRVGKRVVTHFDLTSMRRRE